MTEDNPEAFKALTPDPDPGFAADAAYVEREAKKFYYSWRIACGLPVHPRGTKAPPEHEVARFRQWFRENLTDAEFRRLALDKGLGPKRPD